MTSHMSSADRVCHQLAVVSEVFKTISALLNVQRSIFSPSLPIQGFGFPDVAANTAKQSGEGPFPAFASSQVEKPTSDRRYSKNSR